jgi:hypothetical protein
MHPEAELNFRPKHKVNKSGGSSGGTLCVRLVPNHGVDGMGWYPIQIRLVVKGRDGTVHG